MTALWYKETVFYELYIRAFKDSNGDGHGDFQGAIEQLDYIQSLGVGCIWILPHYPSPLRCFYQPVVMAGCWKRPLFTCTKMKELFYRTNFEALKWVLKPLFLI